MNFEGLDEADNIYYAHPITINQRMALIMPIARTGPSEKSGIFISFCIQDTEYTKPILLFESPVYNCRTADVNAAGAIACRNAEGRFLMNVLIHRNVPSRCERPKKGEKKMKLYSGGSGT